MATFRGVGVRQTSAGIGTQPAEARKSLAGLLMPDSILGAQQGILPAPGDPLRVSGTAGWEYSVSAGHLVSSRSDADGAVVFGLDGTTLTAAVSAAPGSGSRYDLIYLLQNDIDAGDADASAVLGVVEGTASGTPVKPAVPTGAVVVAEALMAAGATSTQHANVTITQVLGNTVARGGILPVANAAALPAAGYEGGRAVETTGAGQGQEWEWRAGGWKWPKATQGELGYDIRAAAVSGVSTASPGDVVADLSVAVTVPGSRKLRITLMGQAISTDTTTMAALLLEVDAATVGKPHTVHATNSNGGGVSMTRRASVAAGAHTVTVRIARAAGAGTVGLDTNTELLVEDMGAA